MPRPAKKRSSTALSDHRQRQRSRGLKRVEVQVRGEDVSLVRAVAAALADPERAAETRAHLQRRFALNLDLSLKDLLASAPSLDDLNLDRPVDFGRPVEL